MSIAKPRLARRRLGPFLERIALPAGVLVASIMVGLTSYAGVLNLAFTPAVAIVGLFLLFRQPLAYLSFVMWIWMLTPLVRRLSDFETFFHPTSLIMVAPLATTALSALSVLRYRRRFDARKALPYGLVFAVIIYGFFVGALKAGLAPAVLALANWGVPVAFAIHLLISPESSDDKTRAMFRAVSWGAIVLGLYGIAQFTILPAWDAYWMIASDLRSIGNPNPYQIRVFSTLNSPGPFAQYMGAGLLVALATRSRLRWPAITLALIALLLTLVRASWGATFIGFVGLVYWSAPKQKGRYIAAAFALAIVASPVVAFSPLGEAVLARFETFQDLASDSSLRDRQDLYSVFYDMIETSTSGQGIGQTGAASSELAGGNPNLSGAVQTIDSGLVELFFTFGLMGAVFLIGIAAMVVQAWPRRGDPFAVAAMIVVLSALPIMFFGNPFNGATGMLIFPFAALARLYRSNERALLTYAPSRTVAA